MAAVTLEEAMAQMHYPFCTVGGSTQSGNFSARRG